MECRYFHVLLMLICWITLGKCDLRKPLNGTLKSNRLQSGPIFLIDSKTILVTQFAYDNGKTKNLKNKHNKWFKGILRVGSNVTTYVDLEFMNGTDAHLKANLYLGLNIYLHIPGESPFDVTHLSAVAIVNDKNVTKTAVPIQVEDVFDLPEKDLNYPYRDGKFVFVYPKCCPLGSFYQPGTTQEECASTKSSRIEKTERIPVHETKDSKYNNKPMRNAMIAYEPFYYPMPCKDNMQFKFDLQDNVTLLSNLEIFIDEISRPQVACMEFSKEADNVLREAVYICSENSDIDMKELNSSSSLKTSSASLLATTVLFFNVMINFNWCNNKLFS